MTEETVPTLNVPPRAIGFWGGLSANVLNMIGIGPFVTIPLALSALAGPGVLLGWIAGAFLCLCDGMVWAELGSTIPESGGPYHYLREAYGRERMGRLFGFLYLWQTLLTAPFRSVRPPWGSPNTWAISCRRSATAGESSWRRACAW